MVNKRTRGVICGAVAMASGGFTYSVLTNVPMFQRAAMVGTITGIVMALLLFVFVSRRESR